MTIYTVGKKYNTMRFNFLFALLILLAFNSCLNEYEKEVIGTWTVGKYELKKDSSNVIENDLPILTLKEDKTFLLAFKNKENRGNWEADDKSDWTSIEFYFDNQHVQGRIGIDQISILNPWEFSCPFLETMDFARIKK